MNDLGELLEVASEAAAAGAELALRYLSEGIGEIHTKSTVADDPVTAADQAVERLITSTLLRQRPDDLVLGEEYGAAGDPAPGRVRWVVDPIDGTVNYIYGIPHFAVSIAAEVDGVTVVGVVRNATTGEQWTAIRGRGAMRQGRRLTGSAVASVAQALVATGFADYDPARKAHQARVAHHLLSRVRDIRRFGAASLDLCFAAEGRVDAYFEKGLGAWDWAAGGLIAQEAGLLVTGLRGAPPGETIVLAAPPSIRNALHDILTELDADLGP